MQAHVASDERSPPICAALNEIDGLEAINRGLGQRVTAWRVAHSSAAGNATSLLARMDALIAKLEAR